MRIRETFAFWKKPIKRLKKRRHCETKTPTMKLTVTTSDGVFPLEVAPDLELENVKAFCEAATNIPASEMILLHENVRLEEDKKSLKDFGVKDGDMLFLQRRPRQRPQQQQPQQPQGAFGGLQLPDFSKIAVPGAASTSQGLGAASSSSSSSAEDPRVIRELLAANPEKLAMLKHNNPRLAEAYESGNMADFEKVLKEQQEARAERERQRIRMLTADPFDMEAQRLIAKEIENKNIDQNMELAMEYNPESFGTVIMLYIDCKVNGHPIKAFVDSGAQATIMSAKAAERCGIMRLVDRRWAGIAKGVGTQKIIGRVHMAQIQVKDDFLTSSFSILEEQPMDMLLGLDMLKRHQCILDLNRNVLIIGSTKTEAPFLAENELPECARLSGPKSEEDMMREAMERSKQDVSGRKPEDKFTEDNIKELMKYGFDRDKCIEELRRFDGDMKQATAALFAKSLKFQ